MDQPQPGQEINLTEEAYQTQDMYHRAKWFLGQPTPEVYRNTGVYGLDSSNPHPSERLNLNELLAIFQHLHLEPGYELDYVYYNGGLGGRPMVYTRSVDSQYPISPLQDPTRTRQKNSFALDHLYFDPTPEGYFQVTLFSVLSSQFYLFWHDLYNDHTFVFNPEQALLMDFGFGGNKPDKEKLANELNQIDFTPILRLYSNGEARLRAVTFSKWGGFSQREWQIRPPAVVVELSSEVLVEYQCGIIF